MENLFTIKTLIGIIIGIIISLIYFHFANNKENKKNYYLWMILDLFLMYWLVPPIIFAISAIIFIIIELYRENNKWRKNNDITRTEIKCKVCSKKIPYNELGTCEECHQKILKRIAEKQKNN